VGLFMQEETPGPGLLGAIKQTFETVRPRPKFVVLNFPHNPTGYLPPRADFDRVVDITRRAGVHLLCDEMYRFLEQDPTTRLPSAVEVYDKAIVLFGMSKTYGLAGCRVGWLVCHDEELRARFQTYKDWLTICGSAPTPRPRPPLMRCFAAC